MTRMFYLLSSILLLLGNIETASASEVQRSSAYQLGYEFGHLLSFASGFILSLSITLLVAYLLRRYWKQREATKRHIKELELKAIRSQMNPHFIFNALSSIQNLINRPDVDKANEYLIHFSRLLRMVLENSGKPFVTLSDEIEQVGLYLKLEQLRFPFTYSVVIDETLEPDQIELPGMLIQPFVENAVKHAIAPRGKGEIRIEMTKENQSLRISIQDDGPGIGSKNGEGFGINAINEQFVLLKSVYGNEFDLNISDKTDRDITGCCVELRIPLS